MAIDTIEGIWQGRLSYHYDRFADVLYVAHVDDVAEEAYGEEDEQGFHVMRSLADNRLVGLTVLSFWRRYGRGEMAGLSAADLERTLESTVGALAPRLAA
jgi:hypothetical protein